MLPQNIPLCLSWRQLRINRCRKNSLHFYHLPKSRAYISLWEWCPTLYQGEKTDPYWRQGVDTKMSLHKNNLQNSSYLPLVLSYTSYWLHHNLFFLEAQPLFSLLKGYVSPQSNHLSATYFLWALMHININKNYVHFLLLLVQFACSFIQIIRKKRNSFFSWHWCGIRGVK